MRFIAALDTSIYGVAYLQGAPVDTTGWTRRMMLQFLDNGIIAPADISREMLSQVTLDEIGDVDATDPVDGYTLRWDTETSTWVAGPASDVNTLDELEDVDLTYAAPDSGDVLTYDAAAGQWHALPGGGGGGSGVDEVWVDPDEPTVTTYKLWVDTDEEPEAPLMGGSAGRFFDYVYEPGGMAAARTLMGGPTTEGLLHFDVEDQATATEMYVSPLTSSGVDVSARIAQIPVGAQLWVQDRDDSSMHATFTTTGPASYDTGMGMWVAPVTYDEAGSGDPLVPGQPVLAGTLESTGGGGGGTTILDGVGPPAIEVGVDGDYYLDSGADTLYGPKSSEALDAPRFTNADTDAFTATMSGAYRLGMEYKFLVFGQITGARWKRTADADATARQLYLHKGDGTYVAATAYTVETAGVAGWVRASFNPPVVVNPGEQWVVSFDHPVTGTTGYTAPPGPTMLDTTKAQYVSARYAAPPGGTTFPNYVQADVNRFVDLEFRPAGGNIWPVALVGGGEDVVAEVAYRHYQSSASAVWTINHPLGFMPNVTVVDSLGIEVWPGKVEYPTDTQVRITFSAALGGQAYLS